MTAGEPGSGPPRVSLSGDRDGDYVVVEERDDGSLVLEPRPSPAGRPSRTLGGRSLRRRESTATLPQTLRELGVHLERGETVRGFRVAALDGVAGFGLVTDRRFRLIATTNQEPHCPVDRPLTDLRDAVLTNRRRRARLELTWTDGTRQFLTGGRDELGCLMVALKAPASP